MQIAATVVALTGFVGFSQGEAELGLEFRGCWCESSKIEGHSVCRDERRERAGPTKARSVGRTVRIYTKEHRLAVIARDRHCRFDGCSSAARWCEVHHIEEWDRDHAESQPTLRARQVSSPPRDSFASRPPSTPSPHPLNGAASRPVNGPAQRRVNGIGEKPVTSSALGSVSGSAPQRKRARAHAVDLFDASGT